MKNNYLLIIYLLILSSFTVFAQQAPVVAVTIDEPQGVCYPGACTTLSASYTTFKPSTAYTVESINYQPLFAFNSPAATQITLPTTGNLDDFFMETPFTLPFPFCFYNSNQTQLVIGSNGVLSFNLAYAGQTCPWVMNMLQIPNVNFPVLNAIYGVYQDIDFRATQSTGIGSINYYVAGTYPNRVFVMNVSDVPQYSVDLGNLQTSQIVLYETTNIIDILVKRRKQGSYSWKEGVIGVQNAAGTLATAPPNRNTSINWEVLGTAASPSEAWRFIPSGTGPESVTFEWKNQAGTIISTDQTVEVCPTADETYTVKATFTRCDGTTVSVTDSRLINISPPLPVADPLDLTLCTNDPAPYPFHNFHVAQSLHILDGAPDYEYDIYYFTNETAAINLQTSQALPLAVLQNFSVPDSNPVTIYALIMETGGASCHNIRPFTIQGGNPSGDFSYPDDGGDPGFCISGVTVPPVLNALTPGGVYTISPSTGLTIDPSTGVLDLAGATPGSYTITYTIAEVPGSCPEWSATPVTVLIDGCVSTTPVTPTAVCEGTPTFNLSTSDAGVGATYTWSGPNGFSSTVKDPTGVPVPPTAGDYTYSVYASNNGVDSTTESVILTVHPLPSASFVAINPTICTNDFTYLVVSGTPNSTVTINNGSTNDLIVLDGGGNGQYTTPALTAATTYSITQVVGSTTPACTFIVPAGTTNTVTTVSVGLPTATMVGFSDPIICSGTAGSFTINGTPEATVTYTVNGINPQDVTLLPSGQLVVNTPIMSDAVTTVYTYELTNIATSGTSGCSSPLAGESATLTVNALPTASFTTSTPTVCQDTPATINFTGTPGALVTFNDGTSDLPVTLDGLGNFVLTTANLAYPGPHTYTLVSASYTASGISCSAPLTGSLTVAVKEDPVFVSITPASPQVLCIDATVTLEVTATGAGLSYQWMKDGVTPVGTDSASLTISSATIADEGEYTVVISGDCGIPVTSTIVELILNQPTVITDEPDTQTVCEGQTITLETVATGVGLSYQWYKGADMLATQTGPILTISPATLADAGSYRCDVINLCQTVTSQVAVVTVNELPGISADPQSPAPICVGGTISLSVTATGTGLSYQWYNGTTPVGANSATLSIAPATVADAGNYTVEVSGACTPAITSGIAAVVVNEGATIVQQTQVSPSDTVCSGDSITLTVITTGGTNVSHQWLRGTTPVGTDSPTLVIGSTAVSDTGTYTCVITSDSCPSITSDPLAITVNQAPSITGDIQDAQICEGQTHNLTVQATGTNVTYQWYRDGAPIAGEVSNSYSIVSASLADSGDYHCVVGSASCIAVESAIVTITVRPLPVATIATGMPNPICEGESTSIVFQGTPGAVVTYNIVGVLDNETALIDPTGFAYATTGTLTQSTTYELVSVTYTGTNACSQALTGSATVIVNELPLVSIEDGYICIDPVTMAVTRTYTLDTGLNEGQYTFEWSDASGMIDLATGSFYEASATGQYSVKVTDVLTQCSQTAFATVDQSSPPVSFTYTVNGFFANNPTVVITAEPPGDYEYQLDHGPFQDSNVFENISMGEHTITVRDPQACDVLTDVVTIIDYPKFFTPNGDGINDTWNISRFGEELNAKIYIFDRFGKLVKEISTEGFGWDGTYNGQPLPATDYWFTLNYDEKGVRKEFKSHFSIKR